MNPEEINALQQELNTLASRYGIQEYVFMYSSPVTYGHISGGPTGKILSPHVLGLIDANRLIVLHRMSQGINKEDDLRKKGHKKKKEEEG